MSEEESNAGDIKDLQCAAVAISVTTVVFFVIYWAVQINSVRELLELAYG
jgi:hypothetical protein